MEIIELNSNGFGGIWTLEGEDLVIREATATWFGGDNDPDDNGDTASGVKTKGNPTIMGCALPVCWWHPSTRQSPCGWKRVPIAGVGKLPSIPWHTEVEVSGMDVKRGERKIVRVELIDNGPAQWTAKAIDLTQEAFRQFAPTKVGTLYGMEVRVRDVLRYSPYPRLKLQRKGAWA